MSVLYNDVQMEQIHRQETAGYYQDIYDWISPLNKWSGSPFIITQQSRGGGGGE